MSRGDLKRKPVEPLIRRDLDPKHDEGRADRRASLKGMSYEEQAASLRPNQIPLKPTAKVTPKHAPPTTTKHTNEGDDAPTADAIRRTLRAAPSWGGEDDDDQSVSRRQRILLLMRAELARISGEGPFRLEEFAAEDYEAALETLGERIDDDGAPDDEIADAQQVASHLGQRAVDRFST